jgi:hypothetical protein
MGFCISVSFVNRPRGIVIDPQQSAKVNAGASRCERLNQTKDYGLDGENGVVA